VLQSTTCVSAITPRHRRGNYPVTETVDSSDDTGQLGGRRKSKEKLHEHMLGPESNRHVSACLRINIISIHVNPFRHRAHVHRSRSLFQNHEWKHTFPVALRLCAEMLFYLNVIKYEHMMLRRKFRTCSPCKVSVKITSDKLVQVMLLQIEQIVSHDSGKESINLVLNCQNITLSSGITQRGEQLHY
jgi:hypothetical protein